MKSPITSVPFAKYENIFNPNKAKTTTIRIIVIIFHVPHSLSDEASGGFIDNERDGLKLSALNEFGVPVITSSIYKIAILNI
jgi:hypothetical protein